MACFLMLPFHSCLNLLVVAAQLHVWEDAQHVEELSNGQKPGARVKKKLN